MHIANNSVWKGHYQRPITLHYPIMKKYRFIILFCLLTITLVMNAQSAPVRESSSYYLPKTALQFTLLIEKKVFTPGEYADYAINYLKESEAVLDAKTTHRIINIKMQPVGVADTAKYFTVKNNPKLSIQKIYVSNDGILRSVNTLPKEVDEPVHFTPAPKPAPLRPRDYMNEEILSAGSKAKMAQLCAEEIYDIRSSRNELTRGNAETMPKDGEQMRLMLASMDRQEQALLQLFEGTTTCDTIETTITICPDREVDHRTLFRFSKAFGLVDADDLSGAPYYINVNDMHQTPEDTRSEKEKMKQKDETGLFVNVPGRAHVTLFKEEKQIAEYDLTFAQFGRTENISPILFGKKNNTSFRISPLSGIMTDLVSE